MEFEFIIRIVVAAVLGGIIGLEREFRAKDAGFRTNFLVALGSALFMVLSAHGFDTVMGDGFDERLRLDVSRIAAQVVTGIGFIGAGAIIIRREAVTGLTTAACVWVVAAIGLACGAGMYLLAAVTTFLVLLGLEGFNYFLNHIRRRNSKKKRKNEESMSIEGEKHKENK